MVKTTKLTPYIYSKESRDYQLFARSFDVIFNYLKYNSSLINYSSDTLVNLLAVKLGYKLNSTIANRLSNFIKSLPLIQKYKGTLYGIEMAVSSFLNSNSINKKADIYIDNNEIISTIVISIPFDLNSEDIVILENILDYVVPVSCMYHVRNASNLSDKAISGEIDYREAVRASFIDNNNSFVSAPVEQEYIQESGDVGYQPQEVISDGGYQVKTGDIRFSKVSKEN